MQRSIHFWPPRPLGPWSGGERLLWSGWVLVGTRYHRSVTKVRETGVLLTGLLHARVWSLPGGLPAPIRQLNCERAPFCPSLVYRRRPGSRARGEGVEARTADACARELARSWYELPQGTSTSRLEAAPKRRFQGTFGSEHEHPGRSRAPRIRRVLEGLGPCGIGGCDLAC